MKTTFIYETRLNSINTLTVGIEEYSSNEFYIIACDEERDIWVEKFAPTFEKAKEVAKKLHDKILKEY